MESMEDVELRTVLSMADMAMDLELNEGRCELTITDTVECEQVMLTCTPEQAAAIWYLAIAGDSGPKALVESLYRLAEPVVGGLPANLRPIP